MADTVRKPAARKPRATASAKAPESIAAKKTAAPKKTPARKAAVASVPHDQIAMLAHRFWEERGRQHGHDAEDWLRAETALLGKAS